MISSRAPQEKMAQIAISTNAIFVIYSFLKFLGQSSLIYAVFRCAVNYSLIVKHELHTSLHGTLIILRAKRMSILCNQCQKLKNLIFFVTKPE
jgi:hypothetical protein